MQVTFIAKDERPGTGAYSLLLHSVVIPAEVDLLYGIRKIGTASIIVEGNCLKVTAGVPEELMDCHPRGIFGIIEEIKDDGTINVYVKLKHVLLYRSPGPQFLTNYPTIREQCKHLL